MTSPVVHRNGRRGTATGRCSPYDSSLIEVEWDDGYVTGELPEDITQGGEQMTDYRTLLVKILKSIPVQEDKNYTLLLPVKEGLFDEDEMAALEEVISEINQ